MDDTDTRISELTARVARLERTLGAHGIAIEDLPAARSGAGPAPVPRDAPPAQVPSQQGPSAGRPVTGGPVAPAPPLLDSLPAETPAREGPSLENQIASRWFNWIGILAVLIAAAWFLKLAFENHWVGPLGRVLIGIVSGAALVASSERFRSKGYAGFSYSLKAVGSGVLYLSLWASFALYHLLPPGAAFAGMIVVTASNAIMALVEDAELLAGYAITGALLTPMLLSTGQNHQISLFTYLVVVDLATLALSMVKPWSRLLGAAFAGTVVYFIAWMITFYDRQLLLPTAIYTGIFFLLFAIAPRLALDHREGDPARPLWDWVIDAAIPALNAIFGFAALLSVFDGAGYRGAGPWIAVLLAAFYLVLINLPARGRLRAGRPRLTALQLVAAITLLTIAIPLKAHGRAVAYGWLAEGTALYWIEGRVRSRLLAILALIALGLGVISTVTQNEIIGATPFLNPRFLCYLAAIAALAIVARIALGRSGQDDGRSGVNGRPVAVLAVLAINLLILTAFGWEIDFFWWRRRWQGNPALLDRFRMYSQLTYSAFFMIFGAILLAVGFWRRSAVLRWQALVLLALTIGKVFLFDVSALSQGYRIVSFLGLGALLLAVSFVYQRDLLALRAVSAPEEKA